MYDDSHNFSLFNRVYGVFNVRGYDYSNSYYEDSEYRNIVNDISDMTGDSHKEVDRKIDAMTRAINGE